MNNVHEEWEKMFPGELQDELKWVWENVLQDLMRITGGGIPSNNNDIIDWATGDDEYSLEFQLRLYWIRDFALTSPETVIKRFAEAVESWHEREYPQTLQDLRAMMVTTGDKICDAAISSDTIVDDAVTDRCDFNDN